MDVPLLSCLAFVFAILGQASCAPHQAGRSFSPLFSWTCGKACEGRFMCYAGDKYSLPHCIQAHHVCDGFKDCKDGSDEKYCSKDFTCPDDHYKCIGHCWCIRPDQFCDKQTDCWNGEDERHCDYRCLDGWVAFEGSCYFFDTTPSDYDTAKSTCDGLDSYIVVIESSAENEFVKSNIRDTTFVGFWIGMKRDGTGTLRWTETGEEPVFEDWAATFPQTNRDCVGMTNNLNYQWRTVPCDPNNEGPTICERRPY